MITVLAGICLTDLDVVVCVILARVFFGFSRETRAPGCVGSSENVTNRGTKKLDVVTMRILMNIIGFYGGEKDRLTGD